MTIKEKLEQHYDAANAATTGIVMAVALYGSQNYDLDTPESDVDTKAFIIPSLGELIRYKQISTQVQGDIEGGLCDIKHISLMMQNFMKQNINFLELLYTDHFILDPVYQNQWYALRSYRDIITSCNPRRMLHATAGMAEQKYHALKHPYESKIPVLQKYGYDPKQLASIVRLEFFIQEWLQSQDFSSAIHPHGEHKEEILNIKAGCLTEDQATKRAAKCMQNIDNIIYYQVDPFFQEDSKKCAEVVKMLDEWVEDTVRFSLG